MKRGIDFVTKFMIEYDVVIPLSVIAVVIVFMFIVIVFLYVTKSSLTNFLRNVSWCLLAGYVFLALCATVFFREKNSELRYSFHPFRCYTTFYYKMMAETILNTLFFMPIGFLIGVAKKNSTLLQILCIGCVLSIIIETIQFVTRRGVCNIDDVIHNTLGCAIGFAGFLLCYKMARRIA